MPSIITHIPALFCFRYDVPPPQSDGKKAIDYAKTEVSSDLLALVPLDKSHLTTNWLLTFFTLGCTAGLFLFTCLSVYFSNCVYVCMCVVLSVCLSVTGD